MHFFFYDDSQFFIFSGFSNYRYLLLIRKFLTEIDKKKDA